MSNINTHNMHANGPVPRPSWQKRKVYSNHPATFRCTVVLAPMRRHKFNTPKWIWSYGYMLRCSCNFEPTATEQIYSSRKGI